MNRSSTGKLIIGSARAKPGELTYGTLEALTLPDGSVESFPVIIAQGRRDGPTLWLTAGIHGDEYTGIQVIHHLLTPQLVAQLRGIIVAVPTLNPAGLRIGERYAYYQRRQDPNRLFPAPEPHNANRESVSGLEQAYRRLFDHISATASYLIDLHNYWPGAIPFAFRDPVYYHDERSKSAAQYLRDSLTAMLAAFGHTIINEFAPTEYFRKNLHRSVSGAALHVAGIPAFTAELGGYITIDPQIVESACRGIRNVLRWAKLLEGDPEPIEGIRVIAPGYPIRRIHHPLAPQSGIVQFMVRSGDAVSKGDAVARLTDIYGRPLGSDNGLIRTEYDGFVLGVAQGAAFYQGDALLSLAVPDDSPTVLPYPT